MFVLSVVLTVGLLLETLPSAIAGLSRSRLGVARLEQLTRIGLLRGQNLWVVGTLGVGHLAGSAAVIIGLWRPAAGLVGAGLEATMFCWVLSRQLRAGDRGRTLSAYASFVSIAVAVLIVDAIR
ncbi:MAG TPA: hypothetical protein VK662_01635 [Acidothermaceae bacterium]|nr:hypothetical protein [Acidothermaceae bacterium]